MGKIRKSFCFYSDRLSIAMHFADATYSKHADNLSNLTVTSPGTPPNDVPHTLYLLIKSRRINKSAVNKEGGRGVYHWHCCCVP